MKNEGISTFVFFFDFSVCENNQTNPSVLNYGLIFPHMHIISFFKLFFNYICYICCIPLLIYLCILYNCTDLSLDLHIFGYERHWWVFNRQNARLAQYDSCLELWCNFVFCIFMGISMISIYSLKNLENCVCELSFLFF